MPRRERLVLAVFIDALGWEILRRRPFLEDLAPVRGPLATMFGYSSTCDPTILTGVLPREHGHFSSFYYAPDRSPFGLFRALDLLPGALADRGRVRRYLSRGIAALKGYSGYFQLYNVPFRWLPLFDYAEKRDLYQPGGILGGQPTLFDTLRARGVPYHVSDWRRSETENLERLGRAVDAGEVPLAWLFLGHLDALLHDHGPAGAAADRHLAWYEQRLQDVVARARRRYGDVRVHLFSDHGMTQVVRCCDLMARLDRAGLVFGRDYAAMFDSTMARFWFLAAGARERTLDVLAAEPDGRVVSDAELASWGCDFPGSLYGELFFLLHPGVLLLPSFMGRTFLPGMHGFDPTHPDSLAAYATNARDARMPTSLVDLHDLVLGDITYQ